METIHTFHWKQTSTGLFRRAALDVFSDGVSIGNIPDESLKQVAELNGKKFLIPEQNAFWFPKTYRLTDPDTKNVWCEIEEHEDGRIWATISGKRYDIGIREDDNPSQSNGLIMQGYNDKLFSSKNGKLEIRMDQHIELLIVCYFYVRYLRHVRDVTSI